MEEPIENTVASNDELEVFNLEDLWDDRTLMELDLKQFLFKGLVVKEHDYRESLTAHDWSQYEDAHVAVKCSSDAIIPQWATMLVASRLKDTAAAVTHGSKEDLLREYYARHLQEVDWSQYDNQIVVIKGCGSDYVPSSAYVEATTRLQGVARKLMFGEPCSSVPIWRETSSTQQEKKEAKGVKKPDLPSPGS